MLQAVVHKIVFTSAVKNSHVIFLLTRVKDESSELLICHVACLMN